MVSYLVGTLNELCNG